MLLILTITFTIISYSIYQSRWQSALTIQQREAVKDRYVNVMFLYFGIITGLRNVAVGPDTYAYYTTFEGVCNESLRNIWSAFVNYCLHGTGKDMGFPVLLKLFSFVFPSYRIFLIFNALVFYSGAAYITKTNTRTLQQALFATALFITLFFPYAISAMRQTIALGCVMWSYKFIKERRLMPFLAIILIASTLHKSALIFIPYYWIAAIKNVKLLAYGSVLLIPMLFVFARQLTVLLVDTSGSEQYAYYLAQGKDAGTPTFTALLIGCLILYILTIDAFNRALPAHHFFTNSIFITVGLCPVTWIVPDFMRILLYFSCFLPAVMANSITLVPNLSARRYIIAIYIIAVSYLFIVKLPPYDFFWNHMDLGANYEFNRITQGI